MRFTYIVTNVLHTNVTLSVINVERTNVTCMGSKTTMTIPLQHDCEQKEMPSKIDFLGLVILVD
jgi:hypothetical protein